MYLSNIFQEEKSMNDGLIPQRHMRTRKCAYFSIDIIQAVKFTILIHFPFLPGLEHFSYLCTRLLSSFTCKQVLLPGHIAQLQNLNLPQIIQKHGPNFNTARSRNTPKVVSCIRSFYFPQDCKIK